MSLFTRVAPITARGSIVPVATRTSAVAAARPAFFSTTSRLEDRGPVEVTKDTLKKADKVVSGAAVKGIETGERASSKIKDKFRHGSKKAEEEGAKAAHETKKKANEFADEAKETSEEYSGKA